MKMKILSMKTRSR